MKLFSESVEMTFTNSSQNIIQVEEFNEIFFDVYEIEINKNKYPVEKVSEYKGNPVVSIPVVIEGQELYYPFVLTKGKFGVYLNKDSDHLLSENYKSSIIEEDVVQGENFLEKIEKVEDDRLSTEQKEKLENSRQEIIEEIRKAKRSASLKLENLRREKLIQATREIENKKKVLEETVASAKTELVEEFYKISTGVRDEILEHSQNTQLEFRDSLNKNIEERTRSLAHELTTDLQNSTKIFKKNIEKLVEEMYDTLVSQRLDKDIADLSLNIIEKIDGIDENIRKRWDEKVDIASLDHIDNKLSALEKTSVELHDTINRGVNKALSRAGNIDKKVDTINSNISDTITVVENNIKKFYEERIKILEEKTHDINEKTRQHLVEMVRESRDGILKEFNEIKAATPVDYPIEEKNNTKTSIDYGKTIKDLEQKFDSEVTRMRKYVSAYGGGGSVAVQFADGGTMNGDLTVNGNLVITGSLSSVDLIAEKISYDNSKIQNGIGLDSTNVQDAIDELETQKLNIRDAGTNIILLPTTAASDISGYNKLVASTTDADYDTIAVDVSTPNILDHITPTLAGQLISDPSILTGSPGLVNITTLGNIRKVSGNRNAVFYFEVYKRDSDGDETFLCSSDPTPPVTESNYRQFSESALLPFDVTFIQTDRIVIRFFGIKTESGGGDPIYQFQFGGGDPVRTLLPVPASVAIQETWRIGTNETIHYNLGNVGIGTDTPTEKLDVVGNISATGSVSCNSATIPTFNGNSSFSNNLEVLGSELSAPNILFQDSVSYLQPSNDVRNWYIKGFSKVLGEANPGGIFFAPDGLTVFIVGTALDTVLAYPLSMAWEADTISTVASATLSVAAQETNPQDLHFSPDGIYLFIVGTTADRVFRYSMTTPWDISTASYDGIEASLSVAAQELTPTGLTMSHDGLNLYIVGTVSDTVYQYTLGTAWDLSSASLLAEFSVALQEANPSAIVFNNAGNRLYVLGTSGDDITEYRLTVPYDISTASFFSESFTFTFEGTPTGLFIHEPSQNAYMIGTGQDRVRQIGIDKQLKYFGDSFTMDSQLYVGNRAEFRDQVYINGTLQSLSTATVGALVCTGNMIINGPSTLCNTTATVAANIGAGATLINANKTINIGTNGRFGSNTPITVGSLETNGELVCFQPAALRKGLSLDSSLRVKGQVDPTDSSKSATGEIAVFDTFTEDSDLLLQNHTPDIGEGWSRVQVNSATASFTINSATNQLKPTANVNNAGVIYIEDTALIYPDYEVSMDLAVQDSADDNIWLIARYQDADNFYGVKWTTTTANCSLYKRVDGVYTRLGLIPNIAPQAGASDLSLRVVGNLISVVNGGVTKIAAYDTQFTEAGKAGLAGGNIGQLESDDFDVTWRLDNFKVQYYEYINSVYENGDVAINNGGLILKSPNGTVYKITVNNDGSLQTTAI